MHSQPWFTAHEEGSGSAISSSSLLQWALTCCLMPASFMNMAASKAQVRKLRLSSFAQDAFGNPDFNNTPTPGRTEASLSE